MQMLRTVLEPLLETALQSNRRHIAALAKHARPIERARSR